MKPAHNQLKSWLAVHNIECAASMQSVDLTAYAPQNQVIAHVALAEEAPLFSDAPASIDRLERACNTMAFELCLVPPRVALALNHKAYRQCNATT